MPSHTPASGLIKLYYLDGAPWKWPTWQSITGIQHGLFPSDDRLLPKGWTRRDADDIKSYFDRYNKLATEEEKIKFAAACRKNDTIPGRIKWRTFVNDSWDRWRIHDLVVEGLRKEHVHPISILVNDGDLDEWPNADSYISKAVETVGLSLFGVEAFQSGELLPSKVRKCVAILVQRSWSRIREQVGRDKRRMNVIEAIALDAFKALDAGKLTEKKVRKTITSVAKWREVTEIYGTEANLTKANDMLAELNRVMLGLGATIEVDKPSTTKRLCKAKTESLQALATETDLAALTRMYDEYFTREEDDDRPALDDQGSFGLDFHEVDGDLGMGVEASLDPKTLAANLGFIRGLPHQFMAVRQAAGATAWDSPQFFKERDPERTPSYLKPLVLHWHQLAGVHSIIRNVFRANPAPDHCAGMLVADEVGLGKTGVGITTIAFVNQTVVLQEKKQDPPPILKRHPYLLGSRRIESLPHLIIVPGTVRGQWVKELQTFFIPKSVDILLYDVGKEGNADFWSPGGPFHSSKQRLHNRIIVTTHSALQNEMQRTHVATAEKGSQPWELPKQKRSTEGTLFDRRYLTVTLDEAHDMRNVGTKYYGALRVFKQATVKLALTGTPLLTSPKDISSLARILGIPHFLTDASQKEAKADASAIRRAGKMDDGGRAKRAAQVETVRRMQRQFLGHILRRTTDSLNWCGQTLLDLPPHKDIVGVLRLTERETEILEDRAKIAKERQVLPPPGLFLVLMSRSITSANESGKFLTKKFYHEYRTAVCYAKQDPASPNPTFETLEEWEPLKSTKMDETARICRHYLSRDDVPDIYFKDGRAMFPQCPPAQHGQEVTRKRRILIFAEYPSVTGILISVLKLYGVSSLSIDYHVSYEERDKIIGKFHQAKNPRVLIFSSVGSAGLNLAIADIVIFFSQPWSAQTERQIRGRAHRQPQMKTVKAIHLLAGNSADILMYNMAGGKEDMFEAFVNKKLGKELRDLLSGKTVYDEGDMDKLDAEDALGAKSRRSKKRTSRPVIVDQLSDSDAKDAEDAEPPQPKKKGKKGVSRPVIIDESSNSDRNDTEDRVARDAARMKVASVRGALQPRRGIEVGWDSVAADEFPAASYKPVASGAKYPRQDAQEAQSDVSTVPPSLGSLPDSSLEMDYSQGLDLSGELPDSSEASLRSSYNQNASPASPGSVMDVDDSPGRHDDSGSPLHFPSSSSGRSPSPKRPRSDRVNVPRNDKPGATTRRAGQLFDAATPLTPNSSKLARMARHPEFPNTFQRAQASNELPQSSYVPRAVPVATQPKWDKGRINLRGSSERFEESGQSMSQTSVRHQQPSSSTRNQGSVEAESDLSRQRDLSLPITLKKRSNPFLRPPRSSKQAEQQKKAGSSSEPKEDSQSQRRSSGPVVPKQQKNPFARPGGSSRPAGERADLQRGRTSQGPTESYQGVVPVASTSSAALVPPHRQTTRLEDAQLSPPRISSLKSWFSRKK